MNQNTLKAHLAAGCSALLAGCAALPNAPALKPVAVPDALRAAANETLAMISPATGVQTYECRANAGGALVWDFIAPTAELFDQKGQRIGKHYAGPTWELPDGSKIMGIVKQRADAPVAGAIPWLLLSAKSTGGPGQLAKVSSLQRVNTVGGVAPRTGCDAVNLGKRVDVPYTADYYYFITM
jgi:Protein of unknown function (DUF3455)